MELWSAFLIGLTGSIHCIGMCGPILVALPSEDRGRFGFISGRIVYNSGRLTSYIFLGFIAGSFAGWAAMFGFQQYLSFALGVAVILSVIIPKRFKNKISGLVLYKFYSGKIKYYMGRALRNNSVSSMFGLGILNGLLPCAMVYMALAGAASFGDHLSAMLYMALFGMGTLPLMLTLSAAGKYAGAGLRKKLNKLVPVLVILLGVIFILRGMGLGIRYLSPNISEHMNSCSMKSPNMESSGMKPALNRAVGDSYSK